MCLPYDQQAGTYHLQITGLEKDAQKILFTSCSLSGHRSMPVSGLILQSDIRTFLLEQQHLPSYRGPSKDLRSKLDLYSSLVPTVKEQQEDHWPCKILVYPRWPFVPSQLLCFFILPFSANSVPIFFSLVRNEKKLYLWRGCGYPAVDASTLRPNSKLILGSKVSQSRGWSHWLK